MRRMTGLSGLLVAMLLLAACGRTDSGTTTSSPSTGSGTTTSSPSTSSGTATSSPSTSSSSTLYLYNWGDYIDPALIEAFQSESGIKLQVDTFETNEDMIAKVRAGGSGYDLVVPSDYAVKVMVAEGLLEPLDKSKLSNLGNLDPTLMGMYFDPQNTHSVPYLYGTTGIAYNRSAFPKGVDSWAALFDPAQLEAVRGKASMLDDEREAPGAALHYLGASMNTTDTVQLGKAQALLLAQKPFLAAYNSSNFQRLLASGEYMIAQAVSGDALLARRGLTDEFSGNPEIAFVIPKEGGTIWMDNLAILANSPNKAAAYRFIDFMLRPDIAARNAEYTGYLTPNQAARAQLSEDLKALYAEGFAPDQATYARLEWIKRGEGSEAFSELWTAVKSK